MDYMPLKKQSSNKEKFNDPQEVAPPVIEQAIIDNSKNPHSEALEHILYCTGCKSLFLAELSFYEKNRELTDMIPYIFMVLVFVIIQLLLKK